MSVKATFPNISFPLLYSARLTKKKNGGRIWKLEAKELLLSEDPHDNRQGQTNTEMLAGSSLSLLPRSKLLPLTTGPIDHQSPRPSSRPWLKTSRAHRSPQTFSWHSFWILLLQLHVPGFLDSLQVLALQVHLHQGFMGAD